MLHQNTSNYTVLRQVSEGQAREPARGGAGPLILGLSRPPHCRPPPRAREAGGSCAVRCVAFPLAAERETVP